MPEQLEFLNAAEPAADGPDLNRLHVRESTRARRMFLHVRLPHGVELVVPRGTRPRTVQSFVEAHKGWIDKAWEQIANEYVGDRSQRPRSANLQAVGQQFEINYEHVPGARRRWLLKDDKLALRCKQADFSDASKILRNWLLAQARLVLPVRVYEEAEQVGDKPARVQVRLQRTRWGSCSATGTISVNAALMFLEPKLARYLIIHELCHIRHMNHSRSYWKHVAKFEPGYRELDKALSRSWQHIPWWAMAA